MLSLGIEGATAPNATGSKSLKALFEGLIFRDTGIVNNPSIYCTWICFPGDFLRILPWYIAIVHHHVGKSFFYVFQALSKSYEDMAGYFWGANQRFPADVCETTQVEIDGEVRSMAAEYVLEAQVQGVGVVRGQLSGDNLWDSPQEPLENTIDIYIYT